jgi:hypothetical protein
LYDEVSELVAQPFERVERDRLIATYKAVFFSDICQTCPNEHIRGYIDLYRLIHPKPIAMSNKSLYTFEPGRRDASVRIPHKGWTITADTITDEQAEWMLAADKWPGLVVLKSEVKEAPAKPAKGKRGRKPSRAVVKASEPTPAAETPAAAE